MKLTAGLSKVFLLGMWFLFTPNKGIAQEVFDIDKIGSTLDAIDEKKVRETEIARLKESYEEVLRINASLTTEIKSSQQSFDELNLELKYRFLREQIELQRFQFIQNGVVIPEFEQLVEVEFKPDKTIAYITIIFYKTNATPSPLERFKDKIFSPKAGLSVNYPVTSKLIQSGFIKFKTESRLIVANEIRRIVFPFLIPASNTAADKKKYAEYLLSFIKEIDRHRVFANDRVLVTYKSLEPKKAPNGTVEQLIALREKYITFIKKEYDTRQNR